VLNCINTAIDSIAPFVEQCKVNMCFWMLRMGKMKE